MKKKQESQREPIPPAVDDLLDWLDAGDDERVREAFAGLYAGEAANALEGLPPEERAQAWSLLDAHTQATVLPQLHEEARANLIEDMRPEAILAAGETMDVDDLADVVDEIPQELFQTIISGMDDQARRRIETHLGYPEESAGRWMDTHLVTLRQEITVEAALRYMRRKRFHGQIDGVMVLDRKGRLVGKLRFTRLISGQPEEIVGDIMETEVARISPYASEYEVVELFERRDLVTAAVVDEENHLLGRITVDEVIPLIRDHADETLLKGAGLEVDQDLFAPILVNTQRRALWLGINLITAFLAAAVIGLFEATLEKVVALAVLMPIVASMGGIAGSQTLTLAIRGLALGQIGLGNAARLLRNELAVGGLNGLLWAVVVACVAMVWFGDYRIGLIIAAAMIINLLAAALCGIIIPLLLDRFGIDPALSGAVVLTTVTDVVGFMAFLGLGTIFLL